MSPLGISPNDGSLVWLSVTTPPAAASESVFNVKNTYGAKGDLRFLYDGVTNSTTTITSATALFTQADVGKTVRVVGGGAAGVNLDTTIASVTNGTTAILTVATSNTATAVLFSLGTPDDAAVVAAMAACQAAGGGRIYFPAGFYLLQNQIVTPNDGNLSAPNGDGPRMKPMTFAGDGIDWTPINAATSPGPNGGTLLDMRCRTGVQADGTIGATPVAKFLTQGYGQLRFEDLCLANMTDSTAPVPLFWTTRTTVHAKNIRLQGPMQVRGTACVQDGMFFGGTVADTDYDPIQQFMGYISMLDEVICDRMRRCVVEQQFANGLVKSRFHLTGSCGSNSASFAAFEASGPAAGVTQGGMLRDCQIEAIFYVVVVWWKSTSWNNTARNNIMYDATGYTTNYYQVDCQGSSIEHVGLTGDATQVCNFPLLNNNHLVVITDNPTQAVPAHFPNGIRTNGGALLCSFKTVTGTYPMTIFDHHIRADATGGAFTVTLPTVALTFAKGMKVIITKIDSSANAVTIAGSGAEVINLLGSNTNTKSLATQGKSMTLQCNGVSWDVVAQL